MPILPFKLLNDKTRKLVSKVKFKYDGKCATEVIFNVKIPP